jgi:hypothetical protein
MNSVSNFLIVIVCVIMQTACSSIPKNQLHVDDRKRTEWMDRYHSRSFPSVFAAWFPAENHNPTPNGHIQTLQSMETDTLSWCRHDLIWKGPGAFGMKFNQRHEGMADGFAPESIPEALTERRKLLACNPSMILLAEIRYRDAPAGYLPDDSPWWKRNENGEKIVGWKEGGFFLIDFANLEFQEKVALQCQAAIRSGVFDGCFLDWWGHENSDRLALLQKIREKTGDGALLIVNVNGRRPVESAKYINGIYMEGFGSSFFNGWKLAAENLSWASSALRKPAITAFEGWHAGPSMDGRNDVQRMRMTTTLSLIFSNGSVLFSDPNSFATPDHLHDWYPFWDKSLGKPISPTGTAYSDGTYKREFEKGIVVLNPPENSAVTIQFPAQVKSKATGQFSQSHKIDSGDGDIFLY